MPKDPKQKSFVHQTNPYPLTPEEIKLDKIRKYLNIQLGDSVFPYNYGKSEQPPKPQHLTLESESGRNSTFPSNEIFRSGTGSSAETGGLPKTQSNQNRPLNTFTLKIHTRRSTTRNLSDSDSDSDSSESETNSSEILGDRKPEPQANTTEEKSISDELILEPKRKPTYDVRIHETSCRSFARRRLINDFKKFLNDAPPGIFVSPTEDDMFLWTISIVAPDDCAYEGGVFEGVMQFVSEYPFIPPTITLSSNIFHPNITESGIICFKGLMNRWSPCFCISNFLTSVQFLLAEPSTQEPANELAAKVFDSNPAMYVEMARQCVDQQLNQN